MARDLWEFYLKTQFVVALKRFPKIIFNKDHVIAIIFHNKKTTKILFRGFLKQSKYQLMIDDAQLKRFITLGNFSPGLMTKSL